MNSSIVLGAIFVLIAAAEIGAAHQLRASLVRGGFGLSIGAILTLILGVRFLIQRPLLGIGLTCLFVAVAQIVAIYTLVKLIRDRAEDEDEDRPQQVMPYGAQPGGYGGYGPTPPTTAGRQPPS